MTHYERHLEEVLIFFVAVFEPPDASSLMRNPSCGVDGTGNVSQTWDIRYASVDYYQRGIYG